jgi:hypothetical protein
MGTDRIQTEDTLKMSVCSLTNDLKSSVSDPDPFRSRTFWLDPDTEV